MKELKQRNIKLGIISSKYKEYFDFEIYAKGTLNTNLLSKYLMENNINNNDVLIIGSTVQAMQCAKKANLDHALALWERDNSNNISATYYLKTPADIVNLINDRKGTYQWLDWAIELQAIAQTGLQYSKDRFDLERFQRIRDISAEIMRQKSDLSLDKVKSLFCNETDFQTPKLDTRAAIFKDNKILLVKEKLGGKWSLPGGWVDINQSIESNTIKEVKEEAGLTVSTEKLIAASNSFLLYPVVH
ncbi:MAG: NUDIX domain-containing protein [Clostridium sp.]|nr:NUDIX domain-containing protein [Clostridium sp.]